MYDYSEVIYQGAHKAITIKCTKHGYFKQTANSHLSGSGCKLCQESFGEKKIVNYLNFLNIKYIREYRFDDCKFKNPLPFDFYLPDLNICIEFDGIQHFKPIERFGGIKAFDEMKIRDAIKSAYCGNNNIKLIRISYSEIKKIDDILKLELSKDSNI